MTVFTEDPTQFDRWLRATDTLLTDPAALWQDGAAFPQRGVFGPLRRRPGGGRQGRPAGT